jgi:hypothetical protein
MARGAYSFSFENQAVSTAITIIEVAAPSTAMLRIIRAWVSCSTAAVASGMNRVELLRKSATITGTATPPAIMPLGADGASGATQKWKATAEGTDGNILIPDNFNTLSGWLYLPVPEEQILVPPSGIIAIKFPGAPTSANYSAGIVWREEG